MKTIIEFRASKSAWKDQPTSLGWDSILLLEDSPTRLVILGRDFNPKEGEFYLPWVNQQYLVLQKDEMQNFYDEIGNGNYFCLGVYEEILINDAQETIRGK